MVCLLFFLLAFCFVRSLFAFRVPCLACLALVVGGGAFWGVGSALFCVVPCWILGWACSKVGPGGKSSFSHFAIFELNQRRSNKCMYVEVLVECNNNT